ncbi:MAG: zinc dependent phospholipase C family protein [Anaerolineales bacterium]|jgi:hypothetical protein
MGTYICHLRNAETLLEEMQDLDEAAFLFGNLAPDAGIPNQDWTQFDPPRTVTHFLSSAQDAERFDDLVFYRGYLQAVDKLKECPRYSFRLGYFIHLICDNLWSLWVVEATKKYHQCMIATQGEQAWDLFKQDWHDLDRKFIHDHPGSRHWQIMLSAKQPRSYLEYLPDEAIEGQRAHIRDIYIKPNPERGLDRRYPYLNEASMNHFVEQSTGVVLEILSQVERLSHMRTDLSALSMLPDGKLQPFEAPLGDAKCKPNQPAWATEAGNSIERFCA